MIALMAVMTMAVPAFATTDTTNVASIMQTGFDNLRSELLPIIGIALAAGLGIFAIFFGIRKGISLLRRVGQ
jgi:hypothetical protein